MNEDLKNMQEGLQAHLFAHQMVLGCLLASSPEALARMEAAVAHSGDATLALPISDAQREAIQKLLEVIVGTAKQLRSGA